MAGIYDAACWNNSLKLFFRRPGRCAPGGREGHASDGLGHRFLRETRPAGAVFGRKHTRPIKDVSSNKPNCTW